MADDVMLMDWGETDVTRAVVLLAGAFWALSCLKILHEHERGVVLRLGRFHKVIGPGFAFILYPIDAVVRINLREHVPDWRQLGEQTIRARVKEVVFQDKGGPGRPSTRVGG